MVYSHDRGHKIKLSKNGWKYCDNNQPVSDDRPCKKCGRLPTKDGYDACLGYIENATSACCGHGVEDLYIILKLK